MARCNEPAGGLRRDAKVSGSAPTAPVPAPDDYLETLVREGAEVLVRYTGKQTSKAGRVFKAFEVFVAGDDALVDIPEFPLRLASGEES